MNDLSALLSPMKHDDGPDYEGAGKHMMLKDRLRNKENWMEKLRRIQNQSEAKLGAENIGRNSGVALTKDSSMVSLGGKMAMSRTLPQNINF